MSATSHDGAPTYNDEPIDFLVNPLRSTPTDLISGGSAALEFHRKLPGYAPTPLVQLPGVAERLGVAQVIAKVESSRLGLPAFKMLGASWATYRVLVGRLGFEPVWSTIEELSAAFEPLRPLTLATATDGNHGRAVSRMAELLGLACEIFVPLGMVEARISAIRSHGANVTIIDGTYDDAVRAAAAHAAADTTGRTEVVSDTSWPGYVEPPRNVIAGYSTIFGEIDADLAGEGWERPSHWFAQAGVGALLAAVIAGVRTGDAADAPSTIVCVEPSDADCLLESARAGSLVEVPGPHRSQMVGLNCGTGSPEAWPSVSTGTDIFVAVPDDLCEEALRVLAAEGIRAGETGSASLAGALALSAGDYRGLSGLTKDSIVGIIVTEGVTDPVNWDRIVG